MARLDGEDTLAGYDGRGGWASLSFYKSEPSGNIVFCARRRMNIYLEQSAIENNDMWYPWISRIEA